MLHSVKRLGRWGLTALLVATTVHPCSAVDEPHCPDPPTRVALLGAARDHPPGTHEYLAGLRVVGACLEKQPGVEVVTVRTDRRKSGAAAPRESADVIVGFFYGQQVHADPVLRKTIDDQLSRGTGLVLLHRALQGDGDAGRWIQRWAGAYHGEEDRKYATVETLLRVNAEHPITRGLGNFRVRDEFYYQLKFLPAAEHLTPVLQAEIDGGTHSVAWAWQRPDGGRSFAFSGCHFHENFERPEYRRLVTQAVLWTAGRAVPEAGVDVDVEPDVLRLPDERRPPP